MDPMNGAWQVRIKGKSMQIDALKWKTRRASAKQQAMGYEYVTVYSAPDDHISIEILTTNTEDMAKLTDKIKLILQKA